MAEGVRTAEARGEAPCCSSGLCLGMHKQVGWSPHSSFSTSRLHSLQTAAGGFVSTHPFIHLFILFKGRGEKKQNQTIPNQTKSQLFPPWRYWIMSYRLVLPTHVLSRRICSLRGGCFPLLLVAWQAARRWGSFLQPRMEWVTVTAPIETCFQLFLKWLQYILAFVPSCIASFFDDGYCFPFQRRWMPSCICNVDCRTYLQWPGGSGRGRERLAGFAIYFYAIELVVCALPSHKREGICGISAFKKESVAKHPAFTQEDYPFSYGCIQHWPQFTSIVASAS